MAQYQTDLEPLKKILENKFILLDSNVLIYAYDRPDLLAPVFDFISLSKCAPVYFPLIEFEFKRGDINDDLRKKKQELIDNLKMANMPLKSDDIFKNANAIANAYAVKKHDKASIVDCFIAAYIQKYKENLFLLTSNYRDFPEFLFDRLLVYPLDTGKDIHPLVFCSYNQDKAKKLDL